MGEKRKRALELIEKWMKEAEELDEKIRRENINENETKLVTENKEECD